jgi:uncharacterized membrane protein
MIPTLSEWAMLLLMGLLLGYGGWRLRRKEAFQPTTTARPVARRAGRGRKVIPFPGG